MPEILSIGELLDLGNANNSAYIPYSGLEYNASGAISGISGSAIAGGIESSVVSSIVSSMVSAKADQSAVEECCSSMSAEVSAKLDATASSLFQPSGSYMPSGDYYSATNPSGFITTADLTDFAKESALSGKLDASASSNFAPSGEYVFESSYSSFTSEVTNNITSISSTVSGLTGNYLEKSASSMFAPSGDYAFNSSVSAKLDASSSSLFAPSGDYAYNSALSSYIPNSASGQFAPSGSYADASALSSYIPYSSVAGEDSQITSINGSAIGGTGSEFTGVVTDDTLTGNGLPDSALGVDNYNVLFDSSMYSSLDGNNVTIGVQSGIYQPSGDYYPASNPSGFISSVDLSNYATTGYVDSSVSGKLDSSASSSFYTTDNPSGFITGVDLSIYATTAYVDSSVSGKQDTLTFAYDVDKISAINGSALAGGGGATGDYVEKSAVPLEIGSSNSATNTSVALGSIATAQDMSVAIGRIVSASGTSVALGGRSTAFNASFSFGWYSTADYNSIAMGGYAYAYNHSTVLGYDCNATSSAVAIGHSLSAGDNNTVFGHYNSTANSANTVFAIGDGTADAARHNLLEVAKDGEITMYSSTADTVGTGVMSSIRSKMDSSAIQFVAGSSDATANGVLYILTGNS